MIQVIEFDFESRTERTIAANEAVAACGRGRFCWIDMSADEPAQAETLLRELGVNSMAITEVLGADREGRYDVYEDCLHFAVTEAVFSDQGLATGHVDIVLSTRFIVTFRRREIEFLRNMKRTYREDFLKFAKSPGFLLYEIGDHLVDGYRKTLRHIADHVEEAQLALFGEVDDAIFKKVALLKSDILVFRKVMLASRELLHELGERKSPFISETTQPFLESMATTLERLGSDLSTERDVLSETLALYMGMVSHRTNRVVSRLTVVSVVFLPLGFLVGLYGSNFKVIPGAEDPAGFYWFSMAAASLALLLVMIMKKVKWL